MCVRVCVKIWLRMLTDRSRMQSGQQLLRTVDNNGCNGVFWSFVNVWRTLTNIWLPTDSGRHMVSSFSYTKMFGDAEYIKDRTPPLPAVFIRLIGGEWRQSAPFLPAPLFNVKHYSCILVLSLSHFLSHYYCYESVLEDDNVK